MAVYMSPGVFPREIDISYVVTGFGALRPAIIGTAKKGPLNKAMYISSAQQFIDTFGEPFEESYLGYGVLAYMEEGNQCYVQRVGVEWKEDLPQELDDIAIDISGARRQGWGRVAIFSGIDNGKIALRVPTPENPVSFHNAAITNIEYNDVNPGAPTEATLQFSGVYTGVINDTLVITITRGPSDTDGPIDGSEYRIIRNSDSEIVLEGVLVEGATPGESETIELDDGIEFKVVVTSGTLSTQDSFSFSAQPNNRTFGFWVDRETDSGIPVINEYQMSIKSYDGVTPGRTLDDFVDDFNSIDMGSGELQLTEKYKLYNLNGVPVVMTDNPGDSIQLMPIGDHGEAWALEVGRSLYSWNIPRAKLIGINARPYNINTSNNRINMNVISNSTESFVIPLSSGLNIPISTIASQINAAGIRSGKRYFRAYALQINVISSVLVIEAGSDEQFATLEMLANYSNIQTFNFAQESGINFPYTDSYTGYDDSRTWEPQQGTNPAVPKSCEDDPMSAQCAVDAGYYQHVVGYFIAPSAGTWVNDYNISLELFTKGLGDSAGRYTITIYDSQRNVVDRIEDVSFDKRNDRYVADLINPGSRYGGFNGNAFINWEDRPSELANDPEDASYEVRLPSEFNGARLVGGQDGIPDDPMFSMALDAVVIGNPVTASGIYAFENPEIYDINLLATPGFSSGAVIGQAIQMCQSRGDTVYIVDPPYGLRPQQVVDWHNGMLTSDLRQAINSSYAGLWWSWLEIYDQFSNQHIWIPPSGHALSVFARTSRVAEQWFAPAGLRRGRLLTPIDVEYNPTLPERDLLYGSGNAVNPIVNFPQEGLTIWGQRTLQRRASALDRINVRMLLSYIKKNMVFALRGFVFEQNDEITWAAITSISESFLADIKARRGLEDFRVICDESTNTPERRDRNECWVSVFLKPTKAIEYIVLNLVVMRSTQSFAAEEVLAAGGVVTG